MTGAEHDTGRRFRRYRRQRGLSQKQAAEYLGARLADVSYFETGQHDEVTVGGYRLLCRAERLWALEDCQRRLGGDQRVA